MSDPAPEQTGLKDDKADLKRGAWQILSGFGVRIVARILLIIFVARLYGIENFGRLGETVAIVELTAALATFGLNKTLLGKMVEAQTKGKTETSTIGEAILISAVLSVLAAGALWVIWPNIVNQEVASTRFAILGIPFIALAEIALTATRHRRTVAWDTIVKAVVKPWGFLLMALAVYGCLSAAGRAAPITDGQGLIAAYIASLALSAIVAFYALFQLLGIQAVSQAKWPDLAETFRFARKSLPIAINETAVFAFRRIDIIILALVAGPAATGVYYMAQQVGTVVEKVRYLFEPMLAPIFAQTDSLAVIGEHLRRLCLLVFMTQIAIFALFAILGGSILDFLGTGFGAGLIIILVVLIGELFDGTFGLCELPMVYRNPAWPPALTLFVLGSEVVLVSILAAKFGALGAAIGFALAMVLLAIARLISVRKLYQINVLSIRFIGVFGAGLVAGVAAIGVDFLIEGNQGLVVILSALIFAAVYGGLLAIPIKSARAQLKKSDPD